MHGKLKEVQILRHYPSVEQYPASRYIEQCEGIEVVRRRRVRLCHQSTLYKEARNSSYNDHLSAAFIASAIQNTINYYDEWSVSMINGFFL